MVAVAEHIFQRKHLPFTEESTSIVHFQLLLVTFFLIVSSKSNLGFHVHDLQPTVQVYITWRVTKHDSISLKRVKWRCNEEGSGTRGSNAR